MQHGCFGLWVSFSLFSTTTTVLLYIYDHSAVLIAWQNGMSALLMPVEMHISVVSQPLDFPARALLSAKPDLLLFPA